MFEEGDGNFEFWILNGDVGAEESEVGGRASSGTFAHFLLKLPALRRTFSRE